MASKAPRKLGRPPAANSADTRKRILDVARQSFAELGWETTTNNYVAAKAGMTSAALYHYFDSKLEMYQAVYDDVMRFVGDRFSEALATSDTFVGQFEAVLETAHELNAHDPSLARFLGSARVDIARHDDLQKAMRRRPRAAEEIVARLVDTAISTGEITSSRREAISAFLRTILVGLNDAVSDDLKLHRLAIDAIEAMIEGRLIKPVSADGKRARVRTA
jgi:AcrR family transcriptional regulator